MCDLCLLMCCAYWTLVMNPGSAWQQAFKQNSPSQIYGCYLLHVPILSCSYQWSPTVQSSVALKTRRPWPPPSGLPMPCSWLSVKFHVHIVDKYVHSRDDHDDRQSLPVEWVWWWSSFWETVKHVQAATETSMSQYEIAISSWWWYKIMPCSWANKVSV